MCVELYYLRVGYAQVVSRDCTKICLNSGPALVDMVRVALDNDTTFFLGGWFRTEFDQQLFTQGYSAGVWCAKKGVSGSNNWLSYKFGA